MGKPDLFDLFFVTICLLHGLGAWFRLSPQLLGSCSGGVELAVKLSQLTVEVGLVLQILNLLDELLLRLVINVKWLKLLANEKLQEIVCFLDLADVHLLQLQTKTQLKKAFAFRTYLGHLEKPVEENFLLVII